MFLNDKVLLDREPIIPTLVPTAETSAVVQPRSMEARRRRRERTKKILGDAEKVNHRRTKIEGTFTVCMCEGESHIAFWAVKLNEVTWQFANIRRKDTNNCGNKYRP